MNVEITRYRWRNRRGTRKGEGEGEAGYKSFGPSSPLHGSAFPEALQLPLLRSSPRQRQPLLTRSLAPLPFLCLFTTTFPTVYASHVQVRLPWTDSRRTRRQKKRYVELLNAYLLRLDHGPARCPVSPPLPSDGMRARKRAKKMEWW